MPAQRLLSLQCFLSSLVRQMLPPCATLLSHPFLNPLKPVFYPCALSNGSLSAVECPLPTQQGLKGLLPCDPSSLGWTLGDFSNPQGITSEPCQFLQSPGNRNIHQPVSVCVDALLYAGTQARTHPHIHMQAGPLGPSPHINRPGGSDMCDCHMPNVKCPRPELSTNP